MQLGRVVGLLRMRGDARAEGDGQLLGVAELHARVREAAPEGGQHALQPTGRCPGGDDEELVRSEPPDGPRLVDVLGECCDAAKELIARGMTVHVVDEREVVDVEQRHGDHRVHPARLFERLGQDLHDRSVVEQLGHRVAACGLDEGHGLARDATLRCAEDEEKDDGRDRGGGERGQDRIHACPIQALHDRSGVAGDQHGAERALLAGPACRVQRQELADDVRAEIRRCPVTFGRVIEHRIGLTGEDLGDRSVSRDGCPATALGAAEEDAAVGEDDLHRGQPRGHEVAAVQGRPQSLLEQLVPLVRDGRGSEVVVRDVGLDERADHRAVGSGHRRQHRCRQVR